MPERHRPVVLAVDDDPHVLRAIRRDLSRQYQDRYRVMAVDSPAEALRVLEAVRKRGEEPALLLADQRMPEMNGVDYLARTLELFPRARRVLLTAYADTKAAIDAINQVRLDHYLVKPWEPPQERLYPVLDELLEDWQRTYLPPYDGIRVVGHRSAPATHRVRDLLTRLHQPFRFVDVERDPAVAVDGPLPAVLLPDGKVLPRPSDRDLVEALELSGREFREHYDLAIVGGGPAGLAASVYGSSEGLSTLLVESYVPGGQAGTSSRIENYLGFPSGVSGAELIRRAVTQARRFGTELLAPASVCGLRTSGRARVLTLSDGREISASTVLLSPGLRYNRLTAEGADRFEGAGVYYGATTSETASCVGQHVFVVGGANSAGQAAVHFARHAQQVSLVIRGDRLDKGMSQYLVDEITAAANIEVRLNTEIVAADGDEQLAGVTLLDSSTGVKSTHDTEYVFTFIGARPNTDWLSTCIALDGNGFILTGPDVPVGPSWDLPRLPLLLETSVPGVFAAGDARANSMKRIASSAGEGAMAVALVHRYRAES
ncbi:FAD-dependent oxidoreductase [Kutzneria chonburiensis]|uniref:FAD-dependent oxidoreductase n=1 Tax=Kutzneria chonburiensis TaxID=1483604 RepID=A0ABV6N714_9PSEU|nr:FAD-dependent oxidoreductase [Kutzneria chonburiensis]